MNAKGLITNFFLFTLLILFIGSSVSLAQGGHNPPSTTDLVKFTSVPVTTARVGVEYRYKAVAVSSDPTAVIYYFPWSGWCGNAPVISHTRIDSVTGEIAFTPLQKGWIGISIMARSTKGGIAFQQFEITVSGGNGTIKGKVIDSLNNPIPKVLIEAFKRDAKTCFSYRTVTDSFGNYVFRNLDPGSYLVHAIPLTQNYYDQWFNGKSDPFSATPVIVADSPSVATVNFTLRSRLVPEILLEKVSGRILDTLLQPIKGKGTMVIFVNSGFALNGTNDFRGFFALGKDLDHRLDGSSRFVFKANVDSLGNYTIKVPAGLYIAFAKSPGYAISFYDGKSDMLTADIIAVTPNVSTPSIDFTLAPLPPVALGSISGAVFDSANNVSVRSRIIAFRDRWGMGPMDSYKGSRFHRSYFTDTDSLGAYTLKDLLPGKYIVLALPLGNYAPAFYSDSAQALRWKDATRVEINGNNVTDINIYVSPIPDSTRGFTSIIGRVSQSSNQAAGISGAIVYANNINGKIVGYTITNSNGNFAISGLAPGTYTVRADIPGFTLTDTKTVSPTYDATGNALPATALLSVQGVTGVIETESEMTPSEFTLKQNYPNPFNPTTVISYQLSGVSFVELAIYDVLGREIAVLVKGLNNAGVYNVTWDASTNPSGIYFCKLKAGKTVQTIKMVLAK